MGRRSHLFRILFFVAVAPSIFLPVSAQAQHSVAREWNEQMLDAIRVDFARPTIHSRNLFHVSAAMYDAWAAYDNTAVPYFLGQSVGGYEIAFTGVPAPVDVEAAREEAISFAAYRLLHHRFKGSPGNPVSIPPMDTLFVSLGYDSTYTSTDYTNGVPAALGNYIAEQIIAFGLQDHSNEQYGYVNFWYQPVNDPLLPEDPGNPGIKDGSRWQPLGFSIFIDQSGNHIPGRVPKFLSPEWGQVTPFALSVDDLVINNRGGFDYWVYHDPGAPPPLDTLSADLAEYQWGNELVAVWSSHLDPADSVMWDISPASIGNIQSYPTTLAGLRTFYDLYNGGDSSIGHLLNPYTGQPYAPNIVPRGDYARVLAEFWADGPDSETPPGHWFTILNYVSDHNLFEKRYQGVGPILDDLRWDVMSYFMLGGAVHDASVTAWGIKGWYDYIRPISAIRCMADTGQSTNSMLPNYDPLGIPLEPGYIEIIEEGDPLAVVDTVNNVGKIKLLAWRGPDYINIPETEVAGVGWIVAENWWPYQRPTFVTPPFAGYISGHSTFSRAAAVIMEELTGDAFFPGGMGEFFCPQNEFLVFEDGPSVDVTLQWATYRDASDQTSLSRIWGGIHPPVDDVPGRLIGETIGADAFAYANRYFDGTVLVSVPGDAPRVSMQPRIFPNPFRSSTMIRYTVPVQAQVEITVHDVQGRKITRLVSAQRSPGIHSTTWDGRDSNGRAMASGTYFFRMTARTSSSGEQLVESGKVLLVK